MIGQTKLLSDVSQKIIKRIRRFSDFSRFCGGPEQHVPGKSRKGNGQKRKWGFLDPKTLLLKAMEIRAPSLDGGIPRPELITSRNADRACFQGSRRHVMRQLPTMQFWAEKDCII